MKKQEFLDRLYDALCESMSKEEAQKHIRYYKEYIEEKVKEGRKEKEVIEELDNPRLIAKNLAEAGNEAFKYSDNVGGDTNANDDFRMKYSRKEHIYSIGILLLIIMVIAVIIGAAVGTVVYIVKFIVRFIVPIAIIVGIYWIYKIIKK